MLDRLGDDVEVGIHAGVLRRRGGAAPVQGEHPREPGIQGSLQLGLPRRVVDDAGVVAGLGR